MQTMAEIAVMQRLSQTFSHLLCLETLILGLKNRIIACQIGNKHTFCKGKCKFPVFFQKFAFSPAN